MNAIKNLGMDTTYIEQHLSQGINQDLVDEADQIWCMTQTHLKQVSCFEGGESKASLLSESGIGDPFGEDQVIYDTTAQELLKVITTLLVASP